jgi:hypothetical protein
MQSRFECSTIQQGLRFDSRSTVDTDLEGRGDLTDGLNSPREIDRAVCLGMHRCHIRLQGSKASSWCFGFNPTQ